MLVEFSIYPLNEEHMSRDVARVVDILEEAGLDYRLGPMSTSVEGDWDAVMPAIRRCHQAVAEAGHSRVVTNVVIDDRRDGAHSLDDAVARVEEHLGRTARR